MKRSGGGLGRARARALLATGSVAAAGNALVRAGERRDRGRGPPAWRSTPWISKRVVSFCREKAIDFVVVGPEAPLCAGLVDRLEADGIAAFGPRKAAARIEGSKGFMKDLCARHGVPTAAYRRADSLADAEAFIAEQGAPVVVKADGLAAGKGVVLARTEDEALEAARAALDGAFGDAGAELVIEEMMVGEEASYFALVDGETVLPLETAQDHRGRRRRRYRAQHRRHGRLFACARDDACALRGGADTDRGAAGARPGRGRRAL